MTQVWLAEKLRALGLNVTDDSVEGAVPADQCVVTLHKAMRSIDINIVDSIVEGTSLTDPPALVNKAICLAWNMS